MVRRSIPFYDEIQRMTVEIVSVFARPRSRIYDLGCSTGTTLSLLSGAIDLPALQFVGMDSSSAMLARARDRLSRAGLRRNLVLRKIDLNGEVEISRASAVILNWTLQFIRPLNRARLLRRIREGLLDGGCLIVTEKVRPNDPALEKLFGEFYHALKRRNGYSLLEIARKREALEKVLRPLRLEDNIALLHDAGFPAAEVFFRWYNFAGLLAIR
jgi:tRNA (cmo5U34)-methyltransferase